MNYDYQLNLKAWISFTSSDRSCARKQYGAMSASTDAEIDLTLVKICFTFSTRTETVMTDQQCLYSRYINRFH